MRGGEATCRAGRQGAEDLLKRGAVEGERDFRAACLTYTPLGNSAVGRGSMLELKITASDKHHIHWPLSQRSTALTDPDESIFNQTQAPEFQELQLLISKG